MRPMLTEALRFGIVGAGATLTHAGVYVLALSMLAPQAANLAGFLAALLVSYLGHAHFSFRRAGGPRPGAQVRFGLSAGLGFVLNAGFVALATHGLDRPALGFWAIALITPALSFGLMKFWVFRA